MSARVVVALGGAAGDGLATALTREGIEVVAVREPAALVAAASDSAYGLDAAAAWEALDVADVLVLPADRGALAAGLVSACDRRGVRIVAVGSDPDGARLALSFGLSPALPPGDPWAVADAVRGLPSGREIPASDAPPARGHVIAVWGPGGAPGRSTIAMLLAEELARGRRHAALVDADSHTPSLALSLGLADEGPGIAAACRQAGLGALDVGELARISVRLPHGEGVLDVLCGLNRPNRWPELAEDRVSGALEVCRDWADYTVVDIASALERDEELMSDLEGPRRNAATLAALRAADVVVAVCAADPVGVARFLRGYTELRAVVGVTPVLVIVNKVRPGALGIDARGQVRRALERFAGVPDAWFVPFDLRATDASLLQARPLGEVAPRAGLVTAVRRFAGEALLPALDDPAHPSGSAVPRGGGRRVRSLRGRGRGLPRGEREARRPRRTT